MASIRDILRLFGRRDEDAPLSYESAKEMARDPDPAVRVKVAERDDTRPEILYYLAEDKDVAVRLKIAQNPSTPRQADRILAEDWSEEVRCDLALKIARLVPGLSNSESEALQDLTLEILDVLAQDQLPRVRQILSEELKHAVNAPIVLLRRLALDLELIVAAPVLEYSILLSDDELLEIIAAGPTAGALSAIARRQDVSERIAEAIVEAHDDPAIEALLANPSAQIREETLDRILDRAPEVPPWHEPLVRRPKLSSSAMRRIAGFVSSSLLSILVDRADLDPDAARVVQENVRRRLEQGEADPAGEARRRAERLFDQGKLDDEAVGRAAQQGQREFVVHALALLTRLPDEVIRRILESKTGKAVTAVAWKAALSMRTAIELQRHIARIAPHAIVNARHGVDFPLTNDEMNWFIDYFREI